jgi:hypothetical protein
MRGLAWIAVLFALTGQESSRDIALTSSLPDGVPSVAGWERVAGEADFTNPDFSVRYEFFVRPGREAAYEVVRYRFAGPGAVDYPLTERLQWDVNGRVLHRYECLPATAGTPGGGCTWHEIERGSERYRGEASVLLWLYGLHSRLRDAREAGELPDSRR